MPLIDIIQAYSSGVGIVQSEDSGNSFNPNEYNLSMARPINSSTVQFEGISPSKISNFNMPVSFVLPLANGDMQAYSSIANNVLYNYTASSQIWTYDVVSAWGNILSGIKLSSGTVLLGNASGKIFRSTNGGGSYDNGSYPNGSDDIGNVSSFIELSNNNVIAFCGDGNAYISSEDGESGSWVPYLIKSGITNGTLYGILLSNGQIFCNANGVGAISNDGKSWDVLSECTIAKYPIAEAINGNILSPNGGNDVFVYNGVNTTTTNISGATSLTDIIVLPDGAVLVGENSYSDYDNIYLSLNNGANFTIEYTTPTHSYSITNFAITDNDLYFFSGNGGGGGNGQATQEGSSGGFYQVIVNDDCLITLSNGNILKSDLTEISLSIDNGDTFNIVSSQTGIDSFKEFIMSQNNVMPINLVIDVAVEKVPAGLPSFNTSNVALFTTDSCLNSGTNPGYLTYTDANSVITDWGSGTLTSEMAEALFSQTPNILTAGGQLIIAAYSNTASTSVTACGLQTAIGNLQESVYFAGVLTTGTLSGNDSTKVANYTQSQDALWIRDNNSVSAISTSITSNTAASNTHTRDLLYTLGNSSTAASKTMAAAYAGLAFSVDFTGSNTVNDMHLKALATIDPDTNISQTNLGLANTAGADMYVSIGGVPSVWCSGGNDYFDSQYINLWFKLALEVAGFNALRQTNTKVPQTEEGLAVLVDAYRSVCEQGIINGAFAKGLTWNSSQTFGDPVKFKQSITDNGYYIYTQPIAQQNQTDRIARKAPLVQIAVKKAGAIQFSNVIATTEA